MARFILRNNKVMIEDHALGDWREATDSEKASANITLPDGMANSVHQEMTGESFDPSTGALNPFRRLFLTNFATDFQAREKYLKALKYDVKEVDGMQWAKMAGSKTWRPVDPSFGKGGIMEPTLDLFDMTTDAIKGFLATSAGVAAGVLSAPLGPIAAAGAGAAAGGAVYGLAEKAKQEVGAMGGIPGNVNTGEAVKQGVMAAGMPPIPAPIRIPSGGMIPELPLGMIGSGVKKMNEAALALSGRIAGTEGQMIKLRGMIPGFGRLPTGKEASLKLHAILSELDAGVRRIPARDRADEVVAEFDKLNPNGGINLEPALNKMQEFLLQAAPEGSETATKMVPRTTEAAKGIVYDSDMPKVIGQLYANIRNYLDTKGVDPRNVTAEVGEEVKRMYQGVGNAKVPYGGFNVSDQAAKQIKGFGKIVRAELETKIDSANLVDPTTGKYYSELMSDVSRAKKYIGQVKEGFYSGKTDAARIGRSIRTMRTLFGDTGREYLDAVEMMDRELGTSVYEEVRQAALGQAMSGTFGSHGAPNIFPRFTAQGKFLNPLPTPGALMVGGGYAAGGIPAAAAGLAFASPAGQLGLVKAAQSIPALRSGTQAVIGNPLMKAGVLTSISAARSRQ